MSATRRQHVRRSCHRTLLVALVSASAAGATAGPALGAAPTVLPLATGCGLLVTVPVGVAKASIAVAALPGGQSIAVAFAGPLISAVGTTVALASADVGASGVRVTLTLDGVAQQPVTLSVPGCVAATPGPATPTVDLSPPPPAPLPGRPAEGSAPAPSAADPAGRQVTGLADLTSRGPSDAVPSAEPPSAEPPSTEPAPTKAPAGAVGGPAAPLLESPSAGTTAAENTPDVLLTQLSATGPVVADASLTVRLLSASPSTAARFPISLSTRALSPTSLSFASLSLTSLSPTSMSPASLSAGSSPVAGALPQVAPPAGAPPHSTDTPAPTGSALPITAASRLLHLGRPATGADLTTTAVLLAGALAVVVGQAARRRRWPTSHAVSGSEP